MTIAATLQARMLQTLLQALQTSAQPLRAGDQVEARLLALSPPDAPPAPEGHVAARVLLAGAPALLFIRADAARPAALEPGARLTLRAETAASEDAPATMRLVRLTPPAAEMASAMRQGAPAREPAPAEAEVTLQTLRAAAGPIVGATLARQRALGAVVADALALVRQGAAGPANAQGPANAPGAASGSVPQPVAAAAAKLLGHALDGDEPLTPERLQRAVAQSGLFHEARQGQENASPDDLKGALLALRTALREALAGQPTPPAREAGAGEPQRPAASSGPTPQAQSAPPQPAALPPPPLREAGPQLQAFHEPPVDLPAPALLAKALESTQGALDRIALGQYASLPAPSDMAQPGLIQRWAVELPLLLEGRASALPLEIEEEEPREGPAQSRAAGKLWRVRFALDGEELGPVHAVVTMQGKAVGVTVWAARPETSRLFRAFAPELEGALRDGAFERAEVEVLAGRPQARPAAPGRFLDRVS